MMMLNSRRYLFSKWAVLRASTKCLLMFLLMALMALGAAHAEGQRGKHSGPPADLPGHINYLARQLYGVPVEDAGAIPGQIQTLVLNALGNWMSKNAASDTPSHYPLDVRVRMQLESYFSKLHYPFFGRPAVFVHPWKGGQLIGAGYTLGWSDFDRVNVVAIFESQAGKTQMTALTHFVPYTDLHYAFLPPSQSGDFRFLIYGNRLGKSQPRLSAVLYSFNGKTLENLWEKQDLYDGKIAVTPQTVALSYLIENQYIQAVQRGQLPPRHEAIYKVTPQGLALETEREAPFSQ